MDYSGIKTQYRQFKIFGVTTSNIEIKDILKAWAAISFAFAMIMAGFNAPKFAVAFLLSALTVGVGFIFHEMSHKLVAHKYGCHSEFRANNMMLLLAIVMSFFGFVFAAPGAVFIASQHVGRARNGRISMAGPAANIVLAILFLGAALLFKQSLMLHEFARYGFIINAWLALFNMIPVWGFDGSKILAWNKWVFGIMVAIALGLFVFQYVI